MSRMKDSPPPEPLRSVENLPFKLFIASCVILSNNEIAVINAENRSPK